MYYIHACIFYYIFNTHIYIYMKIIIIKMSKNQLLSKYMKSITQNCLQILPRFATVHLI